MKVLRVIAIVICLAVKAPSKLFSRCELLLTLQRSGMDDYAGYRLGDWICLAYYVSGFNTADVTHNSDGSTDYGIFQLNSDFWCADSYSKSRNLCDLPCRGSQCLFPARSLCMVHLLEVPPEVTGDYVITSYFQIRRQDAMQHTDLLTDQIEDDIVCLKRAAVGPEGLEAWMEWRDHCRNRDLTHWVAGCNL